MALNCTLFANNPILQKTAYQLGDCQQKSQFATIFAGIPQLIKACDVQSVFIFNYDVEDLIAQLKGLLA